MSDSAILAWVTVQQSQQYGQLEDAMDSEKLRGDMASDAAKIKLDMQKATKDPSVYPELNKEIEAFNDKYGSVPEFDDVVSLVNQFADKVATNVDLHNTYKDRKADYDAAAPPVGDDDPRGPEPQDASTLNKDDVTDWAGSLDKIVDSTNQNEPAWHDSHQRNQVDDRPHCGSGVAADQERQRHDRVHDSQLYLRARCQPSRVSRPLHRACRQPGAQNRLRRRLRQKSGCWPWSSTAS